VSKPDTWMPLYIADYLRATMHLTREQHGGYFLLLMACWDRCGRLPNDARQLAGIAKASPAEWRKLSPVLLPFFEIEGDFLIQGRVIAEYEKAAKISETRRQSGLQGGRPRKPDESTEKPNALANENQNGSQNETPTRVAPPSPSPVVRTDPNGSAPPASPAGPDDLDPLAELRALPIAKGSWRLAVRVLVEQGRLSDTKARAIVGKLKGQGLTDEELWKIAEAALAEETEDPVPYLMKAADGVIARRGQSSPLAPEEWMQRRWMGEYREHPEWWRPERGPSPGEPGCRVSPEIQREFGVDPAKPQPVVRSA
jgi:uncharacterized protein YdaU (DUF1376 family)